MAEGEDLIDFRDPDNTGDDDEQEVNRTGAFVPGAFEPYEASTPYHGGEQINFQTTMHEQSGLSEPSYEETAFWGGRPRRNKKIVGCVNPVFSKGKRYRSGNFIQ